MTTSGQTSTALDYRRDIDGLRAIAVLGVVLFHIFPGTLGGGFVGVDVFFVISGFLISRVVWDDIDRGRFSLRLFYSRRVRRIFPALAATLAGTLIAGVWLLFSDELASLGKHAFAGAFFSSNFVLWSESGYFDTVSERKPLLHLWSLSIEEQFYLAWPLLLFAVSRLRLSFLMFAVLCAGASLALSVSLASSDAVAAFYNPLGRFWELTLGAAAGWIVRRYGTLPAGPSAVLAPLAIVAILGGCVLLSEALPFPGWWALLPTVSTALVLCCNPLALASRCVLGSRPMVAIGLISYPLYLWHWPLWSFTCIRLHGSVPSADRLGVLCASFLLATVTYRLIELPLRRRSTSGRAIVALIVAVFSLGALGLAVWRFDGFPQLWRAKIEAPYLSGKIMGLDDWFREVRDTKCHLQTEQALEFAPECLEQRRPALVLWGDSHASGLYPGLRELQRSHNFGLTQWTRAACPPFPESISRIAHCDQVNQETLRQIARLQPEVLLLHAGWKEPNYPNTIPDILAKTIRQFKELKQMLPHTKIVVIGPMPSWNPSLPQLLKEHIAQHNTRPPLYMPRIDDQDLKDRREVDSELQKICNQYGIQYISPERILCEKLTCRTRLDDSSPESLFVWDSRHLTPVGSRFFISQVGEQILSR